MELTTLTIIVQLIFLEGILSIDNAAVLGAMVNHLPNDKPIPWPRRLAHLHAWGDRVLGNQRDAALKVGLLGAYVGRGAMLVLAGWIIQFPWLRVLGAAYLIYLAIRHFGEEFDRSGEDGQAGTNRLNSSGFWGTVLALELADLAFSIDNVIAAVALSSELWVVMLGVAIGILVMRFAAQIFSKLIAWDCLGAGRPDRRVPVVADDRYRADPARIRPHHVDRVPTVRHFAGGHVGHDSDRPHTTQTRCGTHLVAGALAFLCHHHGSRSYR